MLAGIETLRAMPDYDALIARAQAALVNHPALVKSLGAIWDELKREILADAVAPTPRVGTTEYLTWLKLSYKEKLLRRVIADANKSLAQVMESIRYARHVQHNQLPDPEQVGQRFASFDVRWQPRDTIGGDMWWASVPNSNGTFALAMTDSTGHGVPGAMLSVLVISTMARIFAHDPSVRPAQALQALDAGMRESLHQAGENKASDDGCDAAIIRIAPDGRELVFAGAKIDLFHRHAGAVIHHRASRISLGYLKPPAQAPLEHHISLAEGDLLVMVTDGVKIGRAHV